MKMKSWLIVFVLIVVAMVGFSSKLALAAETLKIGMVVSLTGGDAWAGVPDEKVTRLIIDEINAAGGLKVGGKVYKIVLIVENDKSNPEGARSAAEKLVYKDKVKLIIGPSSSALCLAIQEVTEPNKVLFFIGMAWSPALLGPNKPYSFRPGPEAYCLVAPLMEYLVKQLGVKTLAVTCTDDPGGIASANTAVNLGKAFGVKTVYYGKYPVEQRDLSPIMVELIKAKPDIANFCGFAAIVALKQARDTGYRGRAFFGASINVNKYIEIAGKEASEGFIGIGSGAEGSRALPGVVSLKKRYVARYGSWDPIAGSEHSVRIETLLEGIKAAKSVDSTDIKNALEKVQNLSLPSVGKVIMSGEREFGIKRQGVAAVCVGIIRNGKEETLDFVDADEALTAYNKFLDWLQAQPKK